MRLTAVCVAALGLLALSACGSSSGSSSGSCTLAAQDFCIDISPALSSDPGSCQNQGGTWSSTACRSADVGTCTASSGGQTARVRFYLPTWNDSLATQACAQLGGTYVGNPRLVTSPTRLQFEQKAGRAPPVPQTLTVSASSGSGSLSWTGIVAFNGGSPGWLTVTPLSGTTPSQVQVSVDGSGLPVGPRTATFRITGSSGNVDVPVTLNVTPPPIVATPGGATFTAVTGGPVPPSQDIALTTDSNIVVPFTVQVTYDFFASGWLTVLAPAAAPGTLTLVPNRTNLAPATYTATVTLLPSGASGPPLTLLVSYTVAPLGLHAPASVSFAAIRGQTNLPSQSLDVTTDQGTALSYDVSVVYGPGTSGWLTFPTSGGAPGSLPVAVTTTSLPPGTYVATLVLSPANGSAAQQVSIRYDVRSPALSATPGFWALTVDDATTPADIQVAVALGDAGSAIAWSASVTAPWLQASPASAVTPGNLTVSLNTAELETLTVGHHDGAVVLSYVEGGEPVELRVGVRILMSLPLLTLAAPRNDVSGTQAEVVIRGSGLDAGGTVLFGADPAVSATVVDPTEIRATHPALTAGTRLVRIDNALGLDRSTATVTVVDPLTRAAASTATAAGKQRVIFDDARAAAFVVNTGSGALERYQAAASWSKETLLLANLRDAALSMDGKILVAVAGAEIWQIDPEAFALPAARSALLTTFDAATLSWRIAFANDGKAVLVANTAAFTTCQRYDPASQSITSVAGCLYYRAGSGASANGSRVALAGTGLSPPQHPGFYLGNSSAFQGSSADVEANVVELDRTGSRIVVVSDASPNPPSNQVYDSAWSLLGRLQPDTVRAVLTRDGTRAVAWEDPPSSKVRIYDLTAAPVAGIFPELGTPGGVAPSTLPGAGGRIALSADGKTLFLAGDASFVVFPLP